MPLPAMDVSIARLDAAGVNVPSAASRSAMSGIDIQALNFPGGAGDLDCRSITMLVDLDARVANGQRLR